MAMRKTASLVRLYNPDCNSLYITDGYIKNEKKPEKATPVWYKEMLDRVEWGHLR